MWSLTLTTAEKRHVHSQMPRDTAKRVSDGKVFRELEAPDLTQLRSHRIRARALTPRAVRQLAVGSIVKRIEICNSLTCEDTFMDGIVSIADTKGLQCVSTIDISSGSIWLPLPEISFYVSAVSSTYEYPHGDYFNDSVAAQTEENYHLISHVSAASTDSQIILVNKLINSTGVSVNMGLQINLRYIATIGQVIDPVLNVSNSISTT